MLDKTEDDTWVLTPAEITAVFAKAKTGDKIVYCVGDLSYMRECGKHRFNADKTADYTYGRYLAGEAELTRERHYDEQNLPIPNRFEYRVTKR